MTHLLIIGGSDAGISAARRAREVNPDTQVTDTQVTDTQVTDTQATVVVADCFVKPKGFRPPFALNGQPAPSDQEAAARMRARHLNTDRSFVERRTGKFKGR
jgi:hypothetical protein